MIFSVVPNNTIILASIIPINYPLNILKSKLKNLWYKHEGYAIFTTLSSEYLPLLTIYITSMGLAIVCSTEPSPWYECNIYEIQSYIIREFLSVYPNIFQKCNVDKELMVPSSILLKLVQYCTLNTLDYILIEMEQYSHPINTYKPNSNTKYIKCCTIV